MRATRMPARPEADRLPPMKSIQRPAGVNSKTYHTTAARIQPIQTGSGKASQSRAAKCCSDSGIVVTRLFAVRPPAMPVRIVSMPSVTISPSILTNTTKNALIRPAASPIAESGQADRRQRPPVLREHADGTGRKDHGRRQREIEVTGAQDNGRGQRQQQHGRLARDQHLDVRRGEEHVRGKRGEDDEHEAQDERHAHSRGPRLHQPWQPVPAWPAEAVSCVAGPVTSRRLKSACPLH